MMRRVMHALAAAALLVAIATATPISNKSVGKQMVPKQATNYRLPGNVVPTEYTLSIVPFLDDDLPDKRFTFEGMVVINVLAKAATSSITLHSNGLRFSETQTLVAELLGDGSLGMAIDVALPLVMAMDDTHFLTVNLQQPLEVDKNYALTLVFAGDLNLDMDGFYRSSYTEGGVIKWLATTQMEPSDARKAFPCFDEPALKAIFNVAVARKENQTALSNIERIGGPSLPDPNIGGRVWDTFGPTPPMSSYLVAFIVCEFEGLANADDSTFKVWARPDAIAQAQYAVDIGPALLGHLSEFLNMTHGVTKVDNVAISDFSAGAMENWGLVTYREASLLYDADVSTESNKQRVATVLAHELAHFWFGDTVTLAWWDWTWLNEGFARYFQVIAVDLLYPDWQLLDQFVVDNVQMIMRTDSLAATPALTQPCASPAECNGNFGTITYNKGGSVLRMLDHILTRETFKKALRSYVKTYEHQSVEPAQLFAKFDEAATADSVLAEGVTVDLVMTSWTTQAGHPYVRVSTMVDDPSILVITQERDLLRPDPAAPDKTLWWVPLTWTSQSQGSTAFQNTKPAAWMRGEKNVVLYTDIAEDEWVIFNNRQTGFYRVAYDRHRWSLILAALRSETEFPKIDELNRAQLVDDALNLARSGVVDYIDALEATAYLAQDVAYTPWAAAFSSFDFLDSRLVGQPSFWAFKEFVLTSMSRLYNDLTFDAPAAGVELQTRVLGRANALRWACKYELSDCVVHALADFAAWKDKPDTQRVSPNKKSVVYCTALRDGPTAYWDFLWDQYNNANLAADQVTILSALGCTNDKPTLDKYLLMSVTDDSGVRRQDAPSVFTAVYNNPEGVDTALDFLISNLTEINSNYLGSNTLGNAITGLASRLTTQAQVEKLKKFAVDNAVLLGTTSALSATNKAIEGAEADLAWGAANSQTILDWMTQRAANNAAPHAQAASLLLLSAVVAVACSAGL